METVLPNFARQARRGGRSRRISPRMRGHLLEREFFRIMTFYRGRHPEWLLDFFKAEDYLERYKVDAIARTADGALFYLQIKSSLPEEIAFESEHHRVPCLLIEVGERTDIVFDRTIQRLEGLRARFLAWQNSEATSLLQAAE